MSDYYDDEYEEQGMVNDDCDVDSTGFCVTHDTAHGEER